GLALCTVDVAAENAALASPEAPPHVDRGAVVDGARDLFEPQLASACSLGWRRRDARAEALGGGSAAESLIRLRGAGEKLAHRPRPGTAAPAIVSSRGLRSRRASQLLSEPRDMAEIFLTGPTRLAPCGVEGWHGGQIVPARGWPRLAG